MLESTASRVRVILLAGTVLAASLGAAPPAIQANLTGAGSSMVAPLMDAWSKQYASLARTQVTYNGIGSGGGVKAITDKTVQLAGSDAPLNADQRAAAPGLVHIPETLGAGAIIYNLPGVNELKLTGPVLADIYLGKVAKWNDKAIASLNPGVTLPDQAIVTVHRSDGSGTSYMMTDYLSKVSPAWATSPGKGTLPNWPSNNGTAVGAKGNAGVAGVVQQQQYTLGYVEVSYAVQNQLASATLQNAAGKWVKPTLAGIAAAAAGAGPLPAGDGDWSNVSITNAPGDASYPIATFTYLIVYKDLSAAYGTNMSADQANALVNFIWWGVHDGQAQSEPLLYPKLPDSVVKSDEITLRIISFGGRPVLK